MHPLPQSYIKESPGLLLWQGGLGQMEGLTSSTPQHGAKWHSMVGCAMWEAGYWRNCILGGLFPSPRMEQGYFVPLVFMGFHVLQKLQSFHVSFWANTGTCLYVSGCYGDKYLSHVQYAELLHGFILGAMCHTLTLKTWKGRY